MSIGLSQSGGFSSGSAGIRSRRGVITLCLAVMLLNNRVFSLQ